MMRLCDKPGCTEWAQYHAIFQNAQKERLRFCKVHKEEHEKEPRIKNDVEVKYKFIGNEPV